MWNVTKLRFWTNKCPEIAIDLKVSHFYRIFHDCGSYVVSRDFLTGIVMAY